ncbi:short-chain type dehydrogenase, putative [Metarhizium acridum CQMa 102]|uniref:Short-chain type dehydrogenase, putative n=1 Tax=Metarhizium acridum (strain CQMa 102) TaxID=655827 RepID=E9EAR6_METAQ|nr:short-chain type dehydrogenase, putative [Metarhizium acridum CQMa 102]EFY86950.1 short-chain type dehydrogenase, putative [Metarhizium acridum CQMa 102]
MSYNPQRKPVVAVARELVSHGGIQADLGQDTARYYSTDLREEEDVNSSFRKIRHELGSVQVLVYNAGARRVNGRSILDTTAEEFESFTKINLLGAFWSTNLSPGKSVLRALAQIVTREYQSHGIHAAHVIVDGGVDGKLIGGVRRLWERAGDEKLGDVEAHFMQPVDLARIY